MVREVSAVLLMADQAVVVEMQIQRMVAQVVTAALELPEAVVMHSEPTAA
jgi:hypothetical protein